MYGVYGVYVDGPLVAWSNGEGLFLVVIRGEEDEAQQTKLNVVLLPHKTKLCVSLLLVYHAE